MEGVFSEKRGPYKKLSWPRALNVVIYPDGGLLLPEILIN